MNEIQPDRREQMFQLALSDQFLPLTYQGPALEPFLRLPKEKHQPTYREPPVGRGSEGASPLVSPYAAFAAWASSPPRPVAEKREQMLQ